MPKPFPTRLVLLCGTFGLLGWAYWSSIVEMCQRWSNDPQYTQGYAIPVLAFAVLWSRRRQYPEGSDSGSWRGVALVAGGIALRLAATVYYLETLDILSLVPVLAGCLLCAGGWPLLRWALPGMVFLVFMIPLPYSLEVLLSVPLRKIATLGSAFVLQTLGFPAVAEENIILVDEVRIGVVEACSGLGMLFTLFALTTAAALLCHRTWWEKTLVIVSALPITIMANIVRIASTGILYELMGAGTADVYYHDLAGWFMMPVAMLLLWLEFKVLDRLIVEVDVRERRGPYYHTLPEKKAKAWVPTGN